MLKLTVTTTIPSTSNKQNVWFILETDHDDIDDLFNCMADDGCIVGERIFTRADSQGNRIVEKREECVLGIHGFVTIQPAHVKYFEQGQVSV